MKNLKNLKEEHARCKAAFLANPDVRLGAALRQIEKAMKARKTAAINVYHVFGTKSGLCADVTYRGKILKSFVGESRRELSENAERYAFSTGFTHTRFKPE